MGWQCATCGEDKIVWLCPRCGRSYRSPSNHIFTCNSLPTPAELAQMLDNDPELGIADLCFTFDVSRKTMAERLESTHWDRARLRERSAHTSSHKRSILMRMRYIKEY